METDHFRLDRDGWVPNNEHLDVIVYRSVIEDHGEEAASRFESLFDCNGWPPQWRDGVYDYLHYHSTAHEVLGIAGGSVLLMLGGPTGREVSLQAGDAVLLPVGTGHCRIDASRDLLVVGAYPAGQHWDVCRTAPAAEMRQRMRALPIPALDPVAGAAGPLATLWRAGRAPIQE